MTTTTNAENLRQYKGRFSLIVEKILASPRALTWFEKLRIFGKNIHIIYGNESSCDISY